MTADDLTAVAALDAALQFSPWTPALFADSLRYGHHCRVLELHGTVVGFAVLSEVLDEAHLLNIAVAGAHQGRGWGRALLEFMAAASAPRCQQLFLEVRASNHAAQALYLSVGFAKVGERRDYYPGPHGREAGWVMLAPLPLPSR